MDHEFSIRVTFERVVSSGQLTCHYAIDVMASAIQIIAWSDSEPLPLGFNLVRVLSANLGHGFD